MYIRDVGNASSFILSVTDYVPGTYNITIDATDMYGQTTTEVIPVFLSGLCCLDIRTLYSSNS